MLSSKAKPVSFILSHTIQLIRMRFGVVTKQFKLNVLVLSFTEGGFIKENKLGFKDSVQIKKIIKTLHLF